MVVELVDCLAIQLCPCWNKILLNQPSFRAEDNFIRETWAPVAAVIRRNNYGRTDVRTDGRTRGWCLIGDAEIAGRRLQQLRRRPSAAFIRRMDRLPCFWCLRRLTSTRSAATQQYMHRNRRASGRHLGTIILHLDRDNLGILYMSLRNGGAPAKAMFTKIGWCVKTGYRFLLNTFALKCDWLNIA